MPEGRPEDSAEPLVRVDRRLVPLRLYEAEVIVDAAASICRLRAWSAIPAGALILLATRSGSAALGAALGVLVSCQGPELSKRQGAARWFVWDLCLGMVAWTGLCVFRDPTLLRCSPWTCLSCWLLIVEPVFLLFALGPPSRARVFRPAYGSVPLSNGFNRPPGGEAQVIRSASMLVVTLSAFINVALVVLGCGALLLLLCFGLVGRFG